MNKVHVVPELLARKARPQIDMEVWISSNNDFPAHHINPLSNVCIQRYVSECGVFGTGLLLGILNRESQWRSCIIRGRPTRMGVALAREALKRNIRHIGAWSFPPELGQGTMGNTQAGLVSTTPGNVSTAAELPRVSIWECGNGPGAWIYVKRGVVHKSDLMHDLFIHN